MAVLALPDLIGAVIVHLRSVPEIAALASTRISGAKQDAWQLPAYAIWVNGPIGSPRPRNDRDGLHATRVDLNLYGPDRRTAVALWRVVDPAIRPDQGAAAMGFDGAGCRVWGVDLDGGPTAILEEDTGLPVCIASYLFSWRRVA